MEDAKRVGRIVGVMLLLMIAGLMAGFISLDVLRSTDFLSAAAANSARIKTGVVILMLNCFLAIAIGITAWQVFRRYSQPMAMWLIVLGVVMLVMQAADTVQIMSMLAMSQQYVESGAAGGYEIVAASLRTTRRFAHYLELFAIDLWLMMLYAILLRFALVPRLLAGFAFVTVLVQFFAVPLAGFLGYGIYTNLGVPMAFGILGVALWLVIRGFARHESAGAVVDGDSMKPRA